MLDAVTGRHDVRITFDDGNASDVENALPALRERGLRATFFVVAGRLGSPGFLGADDLQVLSQAGMSIGSHGMWHRPWRSLSKPDLDEELGVAQRRIEDVIGHRVTEAACPFGSYDRRVLRTLRSHGYERVFTSDRGVERTDRWLQARNTVHRGDSARAIDEIIAQGRPLSRAVRRRTKLAVKRWR
jgi:peptidoglycan/xylan/chitin deacetylase (PgdA/CDA1 family)